MPRSRRSGPGKLRELLAADAWLREMADEGDIYGPKLLAAPAGEWPAMFASDPHYRSYGTLKFLLEYAHENLERYPEDTYELVAAILRFVDQVETPAAVYRDGLRGLAWKERGNTLFSRNLIEAKAAAARAMEIFDRHSGLAEELARARLLRAKILKEQGDTSFALRLVRQSAATFKEFGNTKDYGMARFIEAWMYFGEKQFRDAYAIICDVVKEAEEAGEHLPLARALHFAGMCARELGDSEIARQLRYRALSHYEASNNAPPAEMTRVRWEHASVLASEGKVAEAIFELYKVRAEFLGFGKIISAGCVALDVVRLKFERGEDVAATASELVTTFVEAGSTPNAIEALAYVREQARSKELTGAKIKAARDFLMSLERRPAQLFAPPPHDEGQER